MEADRDNGFQAHCPAALTSWDTADGMRQAMLCLLRFLLVAGILQGGSFPPLFKHTFIAA